MDKRLQAKFAERSATRALERVRVMSDIANDIGVLVTDEETKTRLAKVQDDMADLQFTLSQRAKI